MIHIVIFNIALTAVFLYAVWRGGMPERVIAVIFAVASLVSYLLPYTTTRSFEGHLALIDLVTFVAVTTVALGANRYWPMYESALLLLVVAVHGVKLYQPDWPHWMYISTNGKLAYPALILLAIGVARHRARVAEFGVDRPWSIGRTRLS